MAAVSAATAVSQAAAAPVADDSSDDEDYKQFKGQFAFRFLAIRNRASSLQTGARPIKLLHLYAQW